MSDKPWWKQTPAAAPDAQRAVRPSEEQPDDGDGDGEGDDDDEAVAEPVAATTGPRDLADGEQASMQGSGAQPYILKNVGGVYSCSCPAWRNAGGAIDKRTCKHLRALRGDLAETARVGVQAATAARRTTAGTRTAGTPTATGTTPPILLAHPWDNVADLTGWWMSEKLDGVRAYWNGEQFVSRLGNPFYAPDWFLAKLPADTPLDGELWAGRKKFQRAVSIARRQDKGDAWRELTYVVFDAPSHPGPFEDRLARVRAHMDEHAPPHARALEHERCSGVDHLRAELARVEALGGEGLMMRQPGSKYEIGRSWTLRKVKTFHDAEARVIAHVRGTGKHAGRLGSLQCQMADGTTFNVGTGLSDAERNNPPLVGTIITYRYQELSNDGVPRFPSYVGVRGDVAAPTPVTRVPVATAAAPAPATAPAPAIAASRTERVFTKADDRFSIELDGQSVKIHHGNETTTRRCTSPAAAWRDADRWIADKLGDGYSEQI
nr:DNA ligase [Kofleriaceae bacterium]